MAEPEFKVYGLIYSPASRAVFAFLRANAIPYDLEVINIARGEQKSPEYLAINPNGVIPSLTHGDFSMGESGAIATYVAEIKNLANNWWPADLQERGRVISYLHWHNLGALKKIGIHVMRSVISPKAIGRSYSEEELAIGRNGCDQAMNDLNEFLKMGDWIVGTREASAADIFACSIVQHAVVFCQYDLTPYEHLRNWYERIIQFDGVRDIHEEFVQATSQF